jgi:hypothetical protein
MHNRRRKFEEGRKSLYPPSVRSWQSRQQVGVEVLVDLQLCHLLSKRFEVLSQLTLL